MAYRGKTEIDVNDIYIPLLNINPEGMLQREIKDIIEELDIMLQITKSHKIVLRDFITNVEHILDPDGVFGGVRKRLHKDLSSSPTPGPQDLTGINPRKTQSDDWNINDKEKFNWFRLNADELWNRVSRRIEELEDLRQSAESTSNSVSPSLQVAGTSTNSTGL